MDFLKTILPANALRVNFIQPFVIVPHSPTSASGTVDMGTTKKSLGQYYAYYTYVYP